ncbi:MAG TPA: thioesterase domain-containing protein, partial [Ktedonobacteraceae bacterium]|nr:thioesterase domain-containing protein [Ktedonobacteraceae bacterium]
RRDHQVKIRGYRIELGEITTLLTEHPEIRETIVILREDNPGEKQLIAYVVARPSSQITCEALSSYLREKLPAYMIPRAIVFLDALPTNANGKVDRQALPQPHSEQSSRVVLAPRNTLELKLIQIWEDLLQSSPIGITDDFFELGGHSLLAVRLMDSIQREFQQDLPLSTLFQGATCAQLATVLRQSQQNQKRPALIAIQAGGTRRPFFCVHPVGGEVLCYVDLARQLGPEQPFYGLQMPNLQASEQEAWQKSSSSIEEMAQIYLAEVQQIQLDGPYLLGGWSLGGVIAFEMARQLEQQNQQTALLALFDSYTPSVHRKNKTPLLQQFVEDLEGLFDQTLNVNYTELLALTQEEQLAQIYAHLKRARIVPSDIESSYLSRLFFTYQRNVRALHRYQPQTYAGHLTLFCANSSPEICTGEGIEEAYGWQPFLQLKPTIHTLPGNHYTLLKSPHLDLLVECLKHDLADVAEVGGNEI